MFKCYYLLQCLCRMANPLLQMALQLWWMSIRVTHFKCAWFISTRVFISSGSMLYRNIQSHCQGQSVYEFFKQNALITYQVFHRKEILKGIAFVKRKKKSLKRPKAMLVKLQLWLLVRQEPKCSVFAFRDVYYTQLFCRSSVKSTV